MSSSNIERQLFDIPSNVEFPLELSSALKSKLHSAVEQNWHLKRHVEYLDKEVMELRKQKTEAWKDNRILLANSQEQQEPETASPLMASKLVELSKRNRDMTAQIESMKTKMKQIMIENDQLRTDKNSDSWQECDNSPPAKVDNSSTCKDREDVISSSHQIAQITSKMMEYRRKCQQLRIELKSSLRALSQEVGEGTTPQTVVNLTNSKSWRGRQQQIISLQQKVSELQMKLSLTEKQSFHLASSLQGDGDAVCSFEANDSSSITSEKATSIVSLASTNRMGIVQQDKKKLEQIGKLTSQLETTSQELRSRQQELKATKARIQTLECQTRSFRNQIDILEAKLREKDSEFENHWHDMSRMKQELSAMRDRDRLSRDKSCIELQETSRAMERERAMVARLQQAIDEKQDVIQKLDGEIIELRSKLELCCSKNGLGGLDTIERIQFLEAQLQHISYLLTRNETERLGLVEALENAKKQSDEQRKNTANFQQQISKIFTVLLESNKCIDDCLDAAQITDPNLLQDVENIRTLIRELKTGGELYSLDQDCTAMSAKKLRIKINMLSKEVHLLQTNLRNVEEQRKADLKSYKLIINERMKNECGNVTSQKKAASHIPIPSHFNPNANRKAL